MKTHNVTLTFYLACFLFGFGFTLHTQTFKNPIKDSANTEKSEFRLFMRYSSDYLFMGRSDSLPAPYLSPGLAYVHKSGFYINTSISYLTVKGESRIDMFKVSGGYDFYKNKFETGASITQFVFSDMSFAVQSEISTYLYGYAGYDFNLFMLYVDGSLGFSGQTDAFLGLELNHTFYALNNKLRITPAFYLNTGTQNYYTEYYNNRSSQTGSGKGKGAQQSGTGTIQTSETQKFQILDYEADIQVIYKLNKIKFFVSATWAFPVNPYTTTTSTGTYTEEIKTGFYWSTGVRLTL
ncbi:MAG: hypothetical protein MUF75_10485 [Bacteroidia bacterium]|jgi:hypothetical protein|nr:hypothetical protein [Bacteroidia bacterium]